MRYPRPGTQGKVRIHQMPDIQHESRIAVPHAFQKRFSQPPVFQRQSRPPEIFKQQRNLRGNPCGQRIDQFDCRAHDLRAAVKKTPPINFARPHLCDVKHKVVRAQRRRSANILSIAPQPLVAAKSAKGFLNRRLAAVFRQQRRFVATPEIQPIRPEIEMRAKDKASWAPSRRAACKESSRHHPSRARLKK